MVNASSAPCQVPAGIFMTILCRGYHYPHFTQEETKVLRGDVTCPASHSQSVAELGTQTQATLTHQAAPVS